MTKKQKLLVNLASWGLKPFGRNFNKILFGWLSWIPGHFGLGLRFAIAKNLAAKIGNEVIIERGVVIRGWENLEIGRNTTINEYCLINAEGGLRIGENVRIAYFTRIITDSHIHDKRTIPIYKQGIIRKPIYIEDDVWIGAGATITYGTKIRKGSIVGANAVVTKNTEPFGIYGGVPAKLIRYRPGGSEKNK